MHHTNILLQALVKEHKEIIHNMHCSYSPVQDQITRQVLIRVKHEQESKANKKNKFQCSHHKNDTLVQVLQQQ